jgi:hypothetical protein
VGRVRPKRRGRRPAIYGAIGLLVLSALGVGGWLVLRPKRAGTGVSATPEPSTMEALTDPSRQASAQEIAAVSQLIGVGSYKEARKRLDTLTDRFPTDARLHQLGGHLYFLTEQPTDCLRSFREAIRLDPEMKRHEQILAHLKVYLMMTKGHDYSWKLRQESIEFVERYFDASAQAMLTEFVNTWWEHGTVWRAAEHLQKLGVASGVDWVHVYELAFMSVPSCSKRKQYLQEVLQKKDRRFLPLLRKMQKKNAWKAKYSTHWVSNACLKDEVKAAIAELEALPKPPMSGAMKPAAAMK